MCGCSNEADLEKILSEPPPSIAVTQPVVEEKAVWPTYHYADQTWEVQFLIHTNCHHPAGYVIITQISRTTATETEVWTIDYDNVSNYITEIHYNLKASHRNGSYEEVNVFLPTDDRFRSAFRTAEAIYIAWIATFKTTPVPSYAVIEARDRMKGRIVGLPGE
jgi:hypothetical protein